MIVTCTEFTKFLRLTTHLQYLSPKTVTAGTFEATIPLPNYSNSTKVTVNSSAALSSSSTLLSLDTSSELMELSIDAAIVKFSTLPSGAQIKLLTWLLQLNEHLEWREPILSVLRHIISVDFNSVSGKRLLLSFLRIHNRMIDNIPLDIFMFDNNYKQLTDPSVINGINPNTINNNGDPKRTSVSPSASLLATSTGLSSTETTHFSSTYPESPDVHASYRNNSNNNVYDPSGLGYTGTPALQREIQRYKINTGFSSSKPIPNPSFTGPPNLPVTPNRYPSVDHNHVMTGNPIGGAVYLRNHPTVVPSITTESLLSAAVPRNTATTHIRSNPNLSVSSSNSPTSVPEYSLNVLSSGNTNNSLVSNSALARRAGIVSALATLPVFRSSKS